MINFLSIVSTNVLVATNNDRLFGLDAQLLHDAVILGINVFVIFMFLSYMVFNPARKMLQGRQDKIQADLDQAAQDKESAGALKLAYEEHLSSIDKEAQEIISEARKKAQKQENVILAQAKEEADHLIARADLEIERERKKAIDQMKIEVIDIASAMAKKATKDQMTPELSEILLEDTLSEIGEDTWQN